MSKAHPNIKTLRQIGRSVELGKEWPQRTDALIWAIRVCEAADNLVNVKGRHHSEVAYLRLDEAVNSK